MTIVFENTETMRWQVQEMARAERMLRDEQIQHEVDTYNQIIPEPGELSGTLLLELTSDAQLREWLPRLVGIELHIGFAFADGSLARGKPSDQDEQRLTRADTTAAVHYLRFELSPTQIEEFGAGAVTLISDHPAYPQEVVLDPATRAALAEDFRDITSRVVSEAVRIPILRLDTGLPLPRRNTTETRASTCSRRRRSRSPPVAVARSFRPASRSRSPRATRGSCSPDRVLRSATV